jgi:hypothetical protein
LQGSWLDHYDFKNKNKKEKEKERKKALLLGM